MKIVKSLSTLCLAGLVSLAAAQQAEAPSTATPAPELGTVANPRDTAMTGNEPTLNEADRTFVTRMALSNLFEIESSKVALQQSQNEQVKKFAQQMVTEHTEAGNKLKALAAQKHVSVPDNLDAKHQKMLDRVKANQGEDFDKGYGSAQRRAHKEAIEIFEKTAKDAKDKDLKQFAEQTLPSLKEHEKETKSLPQIDKKMAKEQLKSAGQDAANAAAGAASDAAHSASQSASDAAYKAANKLNKD